MAYFGALAVFIVLYFGLFTPPPFLIVTIHKEFEYIGDVIFSFESRSFLGSVVKLWMSGEITVAYVIVSMLVSLSADRMLHKLKG